jgi:hypothetical protein
MPSSCRIVLVGSWLLMLLLLPGCNALNPLCGSSRPSPSLGSISPATMAFATLPSSFTLTVTGSHFVASSVIIFNNTTLTTTVVSSSELTGTVTSSLIPATGSYKVVVQTPSGNSGNLGCSSGGTSGAQFLTVN